MGKTQRPSQLTLTAAGAGALLLSGMSTLALTGGGALASFNTVFAAQPAPRNGLTMSRPASSAIHTSASPQPTPGSRLDLSPPEAPYNSVEKSVGSLASPHRLALSAQEPEQLPALGGQSTARVPGRLEQFARRVHREGLPVARLWENNSALVSLGLNPKGKPGLWLVQKFH
jgi:hypothetical protein